MRDDDKILAGIFIVWTIGALASVGASVAIIWAIVKLVANRS